MAPVTHRADAALIAPSPTGANLACLGDEARDVIAAGAGGIPSDAMDNPIGPKPSLRPVFCRAWRRHAQRAGRISFHPEAGAQVERTLQRISAAGGKAGPAFNPSSPPDLHECELDRVDLVLIIGANPGFGGQGILPGAPEKIAR